MPERVLVSPALRRPMPPIDPGQVGPATRVRGHGWLALTEPDVGHGVFPAVLPL
ncbi:hypothetical protein [Streptomyces sp. 3214.6]|uniref:hypothetical protein n=1 Tax=Streptomyces sp. 3214.6 TaxID=1882757 RepID=UPI0013520D87|nr:hypothetical protein [Streptomyces sp. 3214.6]